jgi:tRNA A-37 threonylcarbamoyl transferase component Bud32
MHSQTFKALSGRVLNIKADVEGLKLSNESTDGRLAQLDLDVEGIRGKVEKQSSDLDGLKTSMTSIEATAEDVKLQVQSIQDDGVSKIKTGMGYTFNDDGLQISRDGKQMKNLLNEDGMLVTRSGQTILQANAAGVVATDVKVRNYLVVGSHARFEDYGAGRTACFWLEG